jgi:hypothetical protein
MAILEQYNDPDRVTNLKTTGVKQPNFGSKTTGVKLAQF